MSLHQEVTTPTRRTVLRSGAAAGALGTAALAPGALAAPGPVARAAAATRPDLQAFAHGVASGDPLPRRVVIWTRVTPTPASRPGSGDGPQVTVEWEVARDATFTSVVRRGSVVTGPSRDHTVKVDVDELDPDSWYHYRFLLDGRSSTAGRLRTAPRASAGVRRLRLGVVSCANWQAGYFAAYRGIAARADLDAVLCLGDYLYEYAPGQYGYGMENVDVRPHDPPREMVSLEDYRRRHAQYKTDPDLQAAHALCPWIVTWDDHETTNDAWRAGAENHQPATEGDFLARRARAHRAYDEWMPVRMNGTADLGDGARLYRRLTWGRLAEISMLDLRTYRSEQSSDPRDISDPARSITGKRQLEWLLGSLRRQASQWKVIGNPVMIAPVTLGALPSTRAQQVADVTGLLPEDGVPYNVDQWDGYTADRRQVLDLLRDRNIDDALFVTGDIHSAWAAELPFDKATYPEPGGTVGVEFVCSSVTSNNLDDITGGPEGSSAGVEAAIQAANPHIKYLDFDRHGFSVLDITPVRAQMDWFVLGDRRDAGTTITHSASWSTRASSGTVQQADGPVR